MLVNENGTHCFYRDWRQPPEDPLAIKSVKVESKRFDDNISFLGMGLLAVGAVAVIANLV